MEWLLIIVMTPWVLSTVFEPTKNKYEKTIKKIGK